MKLETRSTLAASTAQVWKERYFVNGVWYSDRFERIYNRLIALGENPESDAVDKILGNDSWTTPLCDICDEYVESVVRLSFGGNTSYDICQSCAKKICEMFEVESA